jgi:hypothetical protein
MTDPTIAAFPYPVPTMHDDRPDYETATKVRRESYANLMSVESTLGGGLYGFLGAFMPDPQFTALNGAVPFVLQAQPAQDPIHAIGATAAQITETNRAHLAEWARYNTQRAVVNHTRQYLIGSFHPRYFGALNDPVTGFATATNHELLEAIMAYAVITPDDIQRNLEKQNEDWNPDEPIEVLWQRNIDIQRFADEAQEPVPDGVIIRNTFKKFEESGLLDKYCFAWKQLAAAGQTMAAFKEHFTTAVKDLQDNKKTMKAAGYHGANAATKARANNTTDPNKGRNPMTDGTVVFYCHTHGIGINQGHTSATCNNKGAKHNDTTTIYDFHLKGGSSNIMIGGNRGRRNNTTTPRTTPAPAAANAAINATDVDPDLADE